MVPEQTPSNFFGSRRLSSHHPSSSSSRGRHGYISSATDGRGRSGGGGGFSSMQPSEHLARLRSVSAGPVLSSSGQSGVLRGGSVRGGVGVNKSRGGMAQRPSRLPLEGLRGPNGLSIVSVAAAAAAARARLGLVAARSMYQGTSGMGVKIGVDGGLGQ